MLVPNIKQFTMYVFNIAIDCDLYMIKHYVMMDVRCNWLFTINKAPPPLLLPTPAPRAPSPCVCKRFISILLHGSRTCSCGGMSRL